MDLETVFYAEPYRPARGQLGKDNITNQRQKERLYRYRVCQRSFSVRKGKVFYRLRTAQLTVTLAPAGYR